VTTQGVTEANVGGELRNSSLLLVGRLLSKLINIGVQVAIVRLLSKDDFGVFAYGLALALAAELVVKSGLGRGANRFVPYHAERGENAEVVGILALVSATIVALGVLVFAGLYFVAHSGWSGMPSGTGARVVLILAVLAPVQALDTIGIQTLACFSRPRDILFRKHVLGPALRAAAVAAVALAGGGVEALAWAYLAGGVVGLAICLQLAHRQLRVHGILPLPPSRWRVNWRPLLRFSLPLLSTDLVFISFTGATTVVLMITDGEGGVAAMRAVVPAAALIGLVVQSFSMLFIPSAMRLYARGDTSALREHHWQSAAWVAVLSFPLFGLTFGIAPAFVPVLLGEGYADSARLLAVLAIGHYISVCTAFNNESLQVFEQTRAIVRTDLLMIGLSLGFALVLCPVWGPMGAAVAVTVARLVGTVLRQLVLLQTPGMEHVPAAHKLIWAKLAVAGALVSAIGWIWQPSLSVQLLLLVLIFVALLRSTAPSMALAASFPELLRIPFFTRVIGG
jgi:O-antigen/teichoic acid export membrane protein